MVLLMINVICIALIFKMSLQLANLIFFVQGILYMTLSVLVIKQNNERVAQFYSNSNNSLKRVQWPIYRYL